MYSFVKPGKSLEGIRNSTTTAVSMRITYVLDIKYFGSVGPFDTRQYLPVGGGTDRKDDGGR